MNTKELALLGKALDALIEVNAIEKVKELIKYMANLDKTTAKEDEEK